MDHAYTIQEFKRPAFWQRLFNRKPRENALIEVNNLLATKPVREITLVDMAEVEVRYRLSLSEAFPNQLKGFYETYLKKCLEDEAFTDHEVDDLNQLRNILLLKEEDVNTMHEKWGGEIYKRKYEDAISPGNLEHAKKEFLEKLRLNLRLPESLAAGISLESRNRFMNIQAGKMVEDGTVSPAEWEELSAIARNLNVEITMDEASKAKLERMKLYWLIENSELPVQEVDINLQKNEHCYFTIPADWLEMRTVTHRVNYAGPSYRIRIVKGFYYRAGSVSAQRITSDELRHIDSGTLYITNKRMIFDGSKKNTNILWKKVLSITPYSDGVGIEKDSGRSPVLRVHSNADILALLIGRMLQDA